MQINSSIPKPPLANWEQHELEWLNACPLCESKNAQALHEGMKDYIFAAAGGKWKLFSCTNCKCAYLNPRPNRETIGRAYSTYYTHGVAESKSQHLGGIKWLRRALANGYRNRLYGTSLRPSLGQLGSMVARFSRLFRNSVETEAAGLAGVKPKSPGISTILDIGCGSGLALSRAREAGWRVMGIEPDPNAARAATAAGIEIVARDLSELPPRFNGTFERILLNHVIEHVHDPIGMLRRCRDLLAPAGELWLETPNLTSVGHYEFGIDWRGLEPPRHLVIFEQNSLLLSLKDAGFNQVNISAPRDVLNYMFERSSYIKHQRLSESSSELFAAPNLNSPATDDLTLRARELIVKQPNRSEFITLTATA